MNMGPHSTGPKEIDGLLVPPGKDYTLLTDHLSTGKPLCFEPAQEKWFKSNHPYIFSFCGLLKWLYFKHLLDVMASSFWVKVP